MKWKLSLKILHIITTSEDESLHFHIDTNFSEGKHQISLQKILVVLITLSTDHVCHLTRTWVFLIRDLSQIALIRAAKSTDYSMWRGADQ